MTELAETVSRGLPDRYRIERELGRGGMAMVYLADDLRYERPVAVKVLLPELASVVGPNRFLREIRVAAHLHHPNILPLLDSGEAEGLPFYVMPFVEGESLQEKLRREKQLPISEAIQIVREVADALAYAHERGIVHRDIKPANIMLDSGHAVVADFGIALAMEPSDPSRLTKPGSAPGSPLYMSPEQAAGEDRIDGRSDVYSLGCVLYEALAGDPPFTGRMPQGILARKLTSPPPDVRTVRETVPEPLHRIVTKALARSPADRFRTARELGDALEALGSSRLVEAGAATSAWGSETDRLGVVRKTGLLLAGAAACLVLVTTLGFLTTRIYDVKLGIPVDFTPSRSDFPVVGLQALFPELIWGFLAIVGYVILVRVGRLASYALRRTPTVGDTLESLRQSSVDAWRRAISRLTPTGAADLFFLGAVAAGVLTLMPFDGLLRSLWSSAIDPLSSSNRVLHRSYTVVLTLLILALAFTWRRVFRRTEGAGSPGVRFLVPKWGSFAWIVILLMTVTAPYRLLWENDHERVLLNGRPAYVLMETANEMVVYRPDLRTSARYRKGEGVDLKRLGSVGYVFEGTEAFDSAGVAQEGS